ncbi:MAG: NADH-quinone oxidoreductase subunit K, partial [Deltaproteobacteria bacterium]|nr:NADH-quinone oxidoreductase subunit K [Deltaproteobacteria bacterium]
MPDFISTIVANYNYWIYIILMMIGLYAIISKNNLVKKIVGMNIFQTAIILFYISIGAKRGATIPIIEHIQGGH